LDKNQEKDELVFTIKINTLNIFKILPINLILVPLNATVDTIKI